MARLWFVNPNEPEQPAKGVYRWYCLVGRKVVTVYVGNAGSHKKQVRSPSTLERGILEAQRNCLTSNQGKSLDTDFIVGTALKYLKLKRGHDCYWQHVDNDPGEVNKFCEQFQPILQQGIEVKALLRIPKPDGGEWRNEDVELAELELFNLFETYFGGEALTN